MIPEDLIAVATLPDDPDLALLKPPAEIIKAVLALSAGNEPSAELIVWIDAQRGLQAQAEEQLTALSSGGELEDPTSRGLPAWFLEKWASVLRFPWSHKLEWAVESAKSWS